MTQTAAHRLVTEAAAAATYRTAAQVTTEAAAQAATAAAPKLNTSTYTAEKGAANGIATLGSDGKVPAGQLPAAAASPLLGAVKAASTTRSAIGITADPDLVVTVLPGTYWVEVEGAVTAGASAVAAPWSLGGSATFTSPANQTQEVYTGGATVPVLASLTQGTQTGSQPAPAAGATAAFRYSVPIVVTAGGTLAFYWAPGSAVNLTLLAGSHMRAQKLA